MYFFAHVPIQMPVLLQHRSLVDHWCPCVHFMQLLVQNALTFLCAVTCEGRTSICARRPRLRRLQD